MCDPVTIGAATLALSGLETVSAYVGGRQAAEANRQTANYNYAREQDAIGRQDIQLQKENSQKAFDTAITTAAARGKIAASAADRGLAPSSLVSQINAQMFGIGRQVDAEQTNFNQQRQQLSENRVDAAIRRDSQIASMPKPTAASLVIGLGKAGLSGANAYNTAKKAG